MKKTWLLVLMSGLLFLNAWPGEIRSLSEVLAIGKGLLDRDGDGLADAVALRIRIPGNPSDAQMAAAAAVAARANFESLAADFDLVEIGDTAVPTEGGACPIFIEPGDSSNTISFPGAPVSPPLETHQGIIHLVRFRDRPAIALEGGSPEALLKTGRAFFLRWPYLWDIWGRENGATYSSVENDIRRFCREAETPVLEVRTRSAIYSFPDIASSHETVKRLRFDRGEISRLTIRIEMNGSESRERALRALSRLKTDHRRGERTRILSYAGCARLVLELAGPREMSTIQLERVGYPRRLLTPGFKPRSIKPPSENHFDLPDLFTLRASLRDDDGDKIPDSIRSRIVAGTGIGGSGAHALSSRMVMHSAGASFPLLYLDSEIEDAGELDTPVLIGRDNTLIKRLLTTGKLHLPPLEPGQGLIRVIPEAFNKTDALAVLASDDNGLRAVLNYLTRTFPHLEAYSPGEPAAEDVVRAVENLFQGKRGAAEAYFSHRLFTFLDKIQDREPESLRLRLLLPDPDPDLENYLRGRVKERLHIDDVEATSAPLRTGKAAWKKTRSFPWEGDAAVRIIEDSLSRLDSPDGEITINLGVSESPPVRARLQSRIERLIRDLGMRPARVNVWSAYKPGFFWLKESIIPRLRNIRPHRLLIRFARETDDFSLPKRFYSEPTRWLQELYPIDEIISRETDIPLDRIVLEMGPPSGPIYRITAEDESGHRLLEEDFSPRTREIDYLGVIPEWGRVKTVTGWIRIQCGDRVVRDETLMTDLERFWDFYQKDVLPSLQAHILETTGGRPTIKKQPYFRRLTIDLQLSEPDFRLGLDEELISSLEAIHDEIYFDTLDFLRGITEPDPPKTTDRTASRESRASAPGNILPLINPSLEGNAGKAEVTLEAAAARFPRMEISWKYPGKPEKSEIIDFPEIDIKHLTMPALIFDGTKNSIARLEMHAEPELERDYLALIETLESHRKLRETGILSPLLSFPSLAALRLELRHGDMSRTFDIPVGDEGLPSWPSSAPDPVHTERVPTDRIISPEMCLDLAGRLSHLENTRAYLAGRSYEGRPVPVLEIFSPSVRYVSIPRLVTLKPTLFLSGRQHANEVCSTNTILRFAERLATNPGFEEFRRRINIICHPMENPDGAALAYRLQQITPDHSLHAGRYSSLGIDVGSQVGSERPLLPEARVRKRLTETWRPDIHLNLHGYPSHEWVQPFSGYSPFLFRDYWIPRGWFAYYRSVRLPVFEPFVSAGNELRGRIVRAMGSETEIRDSNRRFYDRYHRWAGRWQPHMNIIEEYDGVNIYAARRSSREQKLTPEGRVTYIQETPELMDETARGDWLDFLCRQGEEYLKTHAEYLSRTEFDHSRIEEEIENRIHIRLLRRRPGRAGERK